MLPIFSNSELAHLKKRNKNKAEYFFAPAHPAQMKENLQMVTFVFLHFDLSF